MKKIPLVDLSLQYKKIKKDIDNAIQTVIKKTDFIMGEEVTEFETGFAKFGEAKFSVGVSSGTDALHLVLKALGITYGDEVIVPSHTFTATAEIIVWLGAKPVFTDINPETYTILVNQLPKLITKKTKAIIPVHLYGQSADMDPILNIGKKFGIPVVEDCAQAHGAEYKGKKAGTLGIAGCFSFYPGKNLGAYGDAGAIVTNNRDLFDKIRLLRNHGRKEKYTHEIIGYGNRIDTLQASILLAKLKYLKIWNAKRRKTAGLYNKYLSSIKEIQTPFVPTNTLPVYHLYVIKAQKRDMLKEFLKNKKVETGIHYPIPLHLQPAYKYLGYKKGSFPATEKIAKSILSLPLYPEITVNQIKYIVSCIKEFYS